MFKKLNDFVTVVGALTLKEMFDEYMAQRKEDDSDQTGVQQLREEFQQFVEDKTGTVTDKLGLATRDDVEELRKRVEELEKRLAQQAAAGQGTE